MLGMPLAEIPHLFVGADGLHPQYTILGIEVRMLSSVCLDVHAGQSGIQLQGATAAVMRKTLVVYGMHSFHITTALNQKRVIWLLQLILLRQQTFNVHQGMVCVLHVPCV